MLAYRGAAQPPQGAAYAGTCCKASRLKNCPNRWLRDERRGCSLMGQQGSAGQYYAGGGRLCQKRAYAVPVVGSFGVGRAVQ